MYISTFEFNITKNFCYSSDLTRSDTDSGNRIYDLVNEGLQYLDTRTEFWRQQKPMYARKREKEEAKGAREKNKQQPNDPAKYILKNLEEIDAGQLSSLCSGDT